METVLIVIHLMVVIALVGVVLVQKSEGGALGIGGGGGGNFMSGRGSANVLTRTTTILAVAFFATSISLTLLARQGAPTSILDSAAPRAPAAGEAPADGAGEGSGSILDQLRQNQPAEPQVPQSQ
ncbi:preprotein translocase subunit SecG [Lutibaculum baratangense]|uniref:Protein-export membrane protein SecG n=1 Tax=Lutibaculum baratangense AMV1 TaxID=631454 RepID=V4QUT1_9HYPH|nr:preprotein translocase subunit SecG [Lutibaculum baratangense]ESR23497.1 Preprotein translocase subunit SecG [Lutibaculum baratangense AMV1]